jgi:hypothetical protein
MARCGRLQSYLSDVTHIGVVLNRNNRNNNPIAIDVWVGCEE